MHLANGAVTPACAVYGLAAAGIGMGVGAMLARKTGAPDTKKFVIATSLIFAAQTFNVPILPTASGHVLGGFLLANLFGAGWGAIGMTLILSLQSIVFGDGGITTLGCNVFNMGILPCLVAYPLSKRLTRGSESAALLAAGAFASVVLAAIACSFEVMSQAATHHREMRILGVMTSVHATVGVIEAIFTVLVVRWLTRRTSVVTSAISVASLIVAATWGASPWPDGLEFTLARFSLNQGSSSGLLPDYTLASTLLVTVVLAAVSAAITLIIGKREQHA